MEIKKEMNVKNYSKKHKNKNNKIQKIIYDKIGNLKNYYYICIRFIKYKKNMAGIILAILGLGMLSRVFRIIRNLAFTIISVVGALMSLLVLMKYVYKWILIPGGKFIKWISLELWKCLQWLGNKSIEHFKYRNDDMYWYLCANSMDRISIKTI